MNTQASSTQPGLFFTLEEAQARIASAVITLPSETAPIDEAAERVLAEDIVAPLDLPPFSNSAMDGYAVRSQDLATATPQKPGGLRIAGVIPAGTNKAEPLAAGVCIRIFTGSPVPAGADAVVMQEETSADPARSGWVQFRTAPTPGENIRPRGDDVRTGQTVLPAGKVITPAAGGLLASLGILKVKVYGRPRVGLLATGNELREPGEGPLQPGEIFESNRTALAALVRRAGGIPTIYPLVPDTLKATQSALERAFHETDVVISSGGVSVGDHDFVKPAFTAAGGTMELWKIAIKPGKPLAFGRRQDKLFFGLPGNPVSSIVTFLVLVYPALRMLQGCKEFDHPREHGVLAEAISNPGTRRHFIRVTIDKEENVRSAGLQASHALRSLAAADALLEVPPDTTFPAGTAVRLLRL